MIPAVVGEMFSVLALTGEAMTSGGMFDELLAPDAEDVAAARVGGLAIELPVDLGGERLGQEPRVVRLDGVGLVHDDLEHGLLAGLEGRLRVGRDDDEEIDGLAP